MLRIRPATFSAPSQTTVLVLVSGTLALIPLLLTALVFGGAIRSSERERADAGLVRAVVDIRSRIGAAAATAVDSARATARLREVQVALGRRDRRALRTFRSTHGDVAIVVLSPTDPAPAPVAPALVRTVAITIDGAVVGRVVAIVDVRAIVARVADEHDAETLGYIRAGRPSALSKERAGIPADVAVRDRRYRGLRAAVSPPWSVVLAVPSSRIARATTERQLVIAGAGLLTIVALAFGVGLLLRVRRRPEERRRSDRRSPVALVGDVAAAAHDPGALLPVLLETAVVATNAPGGYVDWNGERIATIGAPLRNGVQAAFPLDVDESGAGGQRIVLYAPRGGFTPASRKVAEALVAQGRIALENAHLQMVVRRQAVTDELTDLANRRRFMEVLQREVARAIRFDSPLALVLFDLDHFKQINDHYGHQVGDEVLRTTATVIRGRVRETDLPARIGGEEFGVVLSGTDVEGAVALAESLRADIRNSVELLGADWPVTASFGVASLAGEGTVESLIGAADRALYSAKAKGRNRVCAANGEASAAH